MEGKETTDTSKPIRIGCPTNQGQTNNVYGFRSYTPTFLVKTSALIILVLTEHNAEYIVLKSLKLVQDLFKQFEGIGSIELPSQLPSLCALQHQFEFILVASLTKFSHYKMILKELTML